ncbi:MAG: hypothetical protein GY699_03400, partial [Desulfobacteraceae bacterium]|nr:hypothetical protein [Desulfobacteraceae bacterium]
SNIIDSGYDEKSIEINMEASGYTLQYKLYAIAALRWLKKVMGDRFKPEKHFGGVLYFYLRGMIKEKQGVFFRPFDALPGLEALESQITEITNEKQ